ncbi:MAG: T6SS immunity protein Tli4 family protein [Providencia rustigianii]|uniref:T6SS immunity protein Tli4 family protein n=1 Tax=Providencia rustigianii TaxID=158850 RepID=UPI003F329E97
MKANNYLKIFSGIIVCLLAISGWRFYTSSPLLTQKDKMMIDSLFEETKPQCIGRYTIDVPISFNNQLNDFIFIDEFKMESKFIYPPAFKQRIELREKELNDAINQPQNEMQNAPFIKESIQLPDNKGIIFDRNISGEDDLSRMLEAHIYVDNIAFIITTKILDLSDPKYSERKKIYINAGFSEFDMNTKPARLAQMKSLISRLSGRINDTIIPTEKGICIPNGFIADDSNVHKNRISYTYENDDLIFGLETDDTILGSDDTLLNRSPGIYGALLKSNQRTIKKGELLLGKIPAQEWLISGAQKLHGQGDPFPSYNFILFANESIASYQQPWLSFGMDNNSKKSRYNQAQMVEIWDRIVGSLRYKPNAF